MSHAERLALLHAQTAELMRQMAEEAEAEAKKKAEAEAAAKREAEAEAKRKAEAEAKRKAEVETKKKAEAELRRKSEEKRKAKVEAGGRLKKVKSKATIDEEDDVEMADAEVVKGKGKKKAVVASDAGSDKEGGGVSKEAKGGRAKEVEIQEVDCDRCGKLKKRCWWYVSGKGTSCLACVVAKQKCEIGGRPAKDVDPSPRLEVGWHTPKEGKKPGVVKLQTKQGVSVNELEEDEESESEAESESDSSLSEWSVVEEKLEEVARATSDSAELLRTIVMVLREQQRESSTLRDEVRLLRSEMQLWGQMWAESRGQEVEIGVAGPSGLSPEDKDADGDTEKGEEEEEIEETESDAEMEVDSVAGSKKGKEKMAGRPRK